MNKALALIAIVLLSGVTGCSTRIEESPVEIVEAAAIESVTDAGADAEDWVVEGSCVAQGPCRVDVYSADDGGFVVSNRYTVKDSRATLNGNDRIGTRLVSHPDS